MAADCRTQGLAPGPGTGGFFVGATEAGAS
jgi:hypothetical protein